jgi:coatomer subunit beta'
LKELALQVTSDSDHKFDLSLQLDDLDGALEIVRSVPELEAETKWKAAGDRALAVWRFDLAKECFEKSGDLGALMLLLLSMGDREGLAKLAVQAGESYSHSYESLVLISLCRMVEEKGQNNLAFAILFQLGDTKSCIDLLTKTKRTPEAAIFARTYAPRSVFFSSSLRRARN